MSMSEGHGTSSGIAGPDAEAHVRRVIEILEGTRTLPLSSSVKLDNKDEVLELLDEAIHRMPDEVKAARWMLRDREEYLAKMRREGDDILEAARLGAERMVQRTEIVREAQHTARRVVEEAREEARRLRLEAEDYCDQKLAAFEIVLERTIKTVAAGRQRLSMIPTPMVDAPVLGEGATEGGDQTLGGEDAFFDQDRRNR
jgi:vacuolar-type H+-ATPase subunit H